MNKLRLLLWDECNRNCEYCCNKEYRIDRIPVVKSFYEWDEIILTGGEPMLYPSRVVSIIGKIRNFNDKAKIFMYTADVRDISALLGVTFLLDGLTVTLHSEADLPNFMALNYILRRNLNKIEGLSLRVNLINGISLQGHNTTIWAKNRITTSNDCPVPENEVLMRYSRYQELN